MIERYDTKQTRNPRDESMTASATCARVDEEFKSESESESARFEPCPFLAVVSVL